MFKNLESEIVKTTSAAEVFNIITQFQEGLFDCDKFLSFVYENTGGKVCL